MAIWGYLPILKFPLYLLTRYLFVKLQSLIWMFNGIRQLQFLADKPEGYKSCVHVQDIWFRYTFDVLLSLGKKEDFVTTHSCFTSPTVLLADNVSLYCLNSKEAIFVKTPASVDVYKSNTEVFMKVAQYKYATQILVMPLEAFDKFAEELGDPKAKVVILSNSGRCGSTLLGQILEATGECLTLCEPLAFRDPCNYQHNYKQNELQHIICNIVRVLCKPQMHKYSCIFIKLTSTCTGIIPFIMRGMPQVKHLFMYRDTWRTIKSFYRSEFGSRQKRILMYFFLSKFSSRRKNVIVSSARKLLGPQERNELERVMDSMLGIPTVLVISTIFQYLHLHRQNLLISAFRYEHMLCNTQKCMEVLFKYCDLPLHLIPKGLGAMSQDSQRGTTISKQNTEAGEDLGNYSGKNKESVEQILNIFKITIPDGLINLPGTVTDIDN